MRAMKDSGIEWIGKIPKEWNVVRLKSLSPVLRGASPRPIDNPKYFSDSGTYVWTRISDVTSSGMYFEKHDEFMSDIGVSKSVRLEPNSLFVSICASVGKPIITKVKCCIHDGFVYFPKMNEIYNRFLYYIFLTGICFQGLGKLGTQLNLNTTTVGNIFIPMPESKYIDSISSFLDSKCAKIDEYLFRQQQVIEKLKEYKQSVITETVTKGLDHDAPMKDSGVEWIGKIPKSWSVRKLFGLLFMIGSGTTPKGKDEYYDGNIPWLNTGDLNDSYIKDIKRNVTNLALKECPALKLYPSGVIVVAMYGATIGKLGISTCEITTNQACCVLSCNECLSKFYLFYIFLSCRPYLLYSAYGSGQPNISQTTIKQLKIPLPSLKEQHQIVSYLDTKCVAIDVAIKRKQELIDKMTEYKKSLIYEAVTGKMEV